jgi:hypothetical protein
MSDEQLYNYERKQEYCNAVSDVFVINCPVFDVVGLEYPIPVSFCEDIIEGTFKAKILVDIYIQASDLFVDITSALREKINHASARVTVLYSFNNEIYTKK